MERQFLVAVIVDGIIIKAET